MSMLKALAIGAILVGSPSLALAQGPGIAPNGRVLPPQSYYGTNGYYGYGYGYTPQYNGLYNYAPGYYRYGYARPHLRHRHWHY
jgi:hypothetical protein